MSNNNEFVKLIIRLFEGGLAPSSQTVGGSFFEIPWPAKPASKIDMQPVKWIRQAPNSLNHYITCNLAMFYSKKWLNLPKVLFLYLPDHVAENVCQ